MRNSSPTRRSHWTFRNDEVEPRQLLLGTCARHLPQGVGDAVEGRHGLHSDREPVRRSGLWNNRHVDEGYDPSFLDVTKERVGEIQPP